MPQPLVSLPQPLVSLLRPMVSLPQPMVSPPQPMVNLPKLMVKQLLHKPLQVTTWGFISVRSSYNPAAAFTDDLQVLMEGWCLLQEWCPDWIPRPTLCWIPVPVASCAILPYFNIIRAKSAPFQTVLSNSHDHIFLLHEMQEKHCDFVDTTFGIHRVYVDTAQLQSSNTQHLFLPSQPFPFLSKTSDM